MAWSEKAKAQAIFVFETVLVDNSSIREQNQQRLRAALDAAASVDGDAQWNEAIEEAVAKAQSIQPEPTSDWPEVIRETALAVAEHLKTLKRG